MTWHARVVVRGGGGGAGSFFHRALESSTEAACL